MSSIHSSMVYQRHPQNASVPDMSTSEWRLDSAGRSIDQFQHGHVVQSSLRSAKDEQIKELQAKIRELMSRCGLCRIMQVECIKGPSDEVCEYCKARWYKKCTIEYREAPGLDYQPLREFLEVMNFPLVYFGKILREEESSSKGSTVRHRARNKGDPDSGLGN
ncbi:hypothetical protein CPB86DRAFT_824933 [Serendipita vermifera]|nr:hypothetical protein CPB86DRAFT_824933 [Serendipita vermifera]